MAVRRGILAALLAFAALPLLLLLLFRAVVFLDNHRFAARVFDGVVPYEAVLASRRWFGLGESFGCTYAVVALAETASAAPPAAGNGSVERFGGDWQPTPTMPLGDPGGDGPWVTCRLALGDALYARLSEAMIMPGGWWASAGTETVFLYSPPTGLAFRLREGD